MSNNFNIVLAEYDGTANENEGVSISGYPTIKLYKAKNKKTPLDFTNPRTVDGIISFMKEHASFLKTIYIFIFYFYKRVEWLNDDEVMVGDSDE